MSVTAGKRLGPYEISELIGAGGMGEVYKGRDTRLRRDVAIKILPASFAADRERLRRFEQEAQAVAALSHPNILAIHDIGQDDGTHFLVSELLEGETLRDLLRRGVPSYRKASAYATQIAEGLSAAHGRGIAHRDLKPENIFITHDGQVKILDFGLAKPIGALHAAEASPSDATVTAPGPATDAGTVMGTAGYMSPEQVRGMAVDCRTDIFSFGAVLYEILTGERAFKRDTAAETMTAILNDDPPETPATERQLPPALDRIIRHCLEKSPNHRFQSASDLAFDLESASGITPSAGLPAAKGHSFRRWWYYAAGAAALVLVAALAAWKLSSPTPVTGSKFHQLTFRAGRLNNARFTPDGRSILYTAAWERLEPEVYTVAADGTGGNPLDIGDARLLAISKQGEIAIALNPKLTAFSILIPGTLAEVSNGGGAPKPEIENIQAADYTPDGSALAIVRYLPNTNSCQLEYPIGKVLYRDGAIDDLRFSPNGRYLAFLTHSNPIDDRGTAVILRTNGEKVATSAFYESAQGLAWTPSGNEVWFTSPLESGAVHALSLSGKNREVLSVPGRLFLRDISPSGELLVTQGFAHIGVVASTGRGGPPRDLSWHGYGYLRDLSPDGKMVLFEEQGADAENYTLYVRNTDGSPAVAIGEGIGLALSPDKNWALSEKFAKPNNQIWLWPVGPGEPRRLSPDGFMWADTSASFTADSKHVIYTAAQPGRAPRTWLQDLSGRNPHPITPEGVVGFQLSPDGKWLLAGKPEDSRLTLLAPFDGGAPVPIAGLRPDDFPLGWSTDNRIYITAFPKRGDTVGHIEKLDPRSGARTAWRDISLPSIEGVQVFPPIITPDGNSYAFIYSQKLSDLYTISGAR